MGIEEDTGPDSTKLTGRIVSTQMNIGDLHSIKARSTGEADVDE